MLTSEGRRLVGGLRPVRHTKQLHSSGAGAKKQGVRTTQKRHDKSTVEKRGGPSKGARSPTRNYHSKKKSSQGRKNPERPAAKSSTWKEAMNCKGGSHRHEARPSREKNIGNGRRRTGGHGKKQCKNGVHRVARTLLVVPLKRPRRQNGMVQLGKEKRSKKKKRVLDRALGLSGQKKKKTTGGLYRIKTQEPST